DRVIRARPRAARDRLVLAPRRPGPAEFSAKLARAGRSSARLVEYRYRGAPPMSTPSSPPKILVVDDFEHNREIARLVLERAGYAVLLAESGERALELIAREAPECVLLDVKMPGVDGFSVCESIRALPQGSDLPIIFLTAMRDVGTFD